MEPFPFSSIKLNKVSAKTIDAFGDKCSGKAKATAVNSFLSNLLFLFLKNEALSQNLNIADKTSSYSSDSATKSNRRYRFIP